MEAERRESEGRAKAGWGRNGVGAVEKNGLKKVNISKKKCTFAICNNGVSSALRYGTDRGIAVGDSWIGWLG